MPADAVVIERTEKSVATPRTWRAWPWLVAMLPFVGLMLWRARHGTGLDADDFGQYLMHARALVEGRPYTDIGYIYSPYSRWIGPQAAPPGLPILLAVTQAIFGPGLLAQRILMMLSATLFVILAGLYFAREDRRLGLGVALLCGLAPELVHGASQILSDLPFAAAVWAVLYLLDAPGRFAWWKIAAVTVLGGFAILLRPTGVALTGAVALYALLNLRTRGIRPAVPVIIWVACLIVGAVAFDLTRTSVIRLHPLSMLQWVWEDRLPLVNGRAYAQTLLAPNVIPFRAPLLNGLLYTISGAIMMLGAIAWTRSARRNAAVLFGFCYGVMLLIMPLNNYRYVWPLLPLATFALLNGVRILWRHTGQSMERSAALALLFAVLLVPPAAANVIAQPAPASLGDVPEVHELFDYIKTRSDRAEMRVTFFKPRTIAWATGVHAAGPLRGKPECLLWELDRLKISHVILGGLSGLVNSDLRKTIAHSPAAFSTEFSNRNFTVYRYRPDAITVPDLPECHR